MAQTAFFQVLKYPLPVIILILFFTAGAAFLIPRIKFDPTVDAFWDKKSDDYRRFKEWQKQFGDDQYIIIAFSDNDIFTEENLKLISRLTEKIESSKFVHKVTSLTSVNDMIGSEDGFIVEPLIKNVPCDSQGLGKIKKRALENPLYVKNVVSEDGKTAALIVELEKSKSTEETYRSEAMLDVQRILQEESRLNKKYYIAGPTPLEFYYISYIKRDVATLFPIVLLTIIIFLLFSFRSIEGLSLPLFTIIISLAWTMAFLYLCRFRINSITAIVPPIILAIVLADSIHLVGKCAERKTKILTSVDTDDFLKQTISDLALPCLLTSLTTSFGFLSLTVSKVQPVRELGLVAGVGVFLAYIVTFTLIPAIVKQFNLFKPAGTKPRTSYFFKGAFDTFMNNIGRFNERYKTFILLSTVLLCLVSFWGLTRLRVETNILDFFRKDTPIYKATEFVEKHLSGTHFLEVSVKGAGLDYFKEPKALARIERLQRFLEDLPEVDKTTSPVDYIKEMNKSFHNEDSNFYSLPLSRKLIAQYLLLYDATDLNNYVDSRWEHVTVETRLNEHSTIALDKVITKIKGYLGENFPPPLKAEVVGWPIMETASNNTTTRGQIQSLGLAILVIFGMMFVVFRSFPVGLISMVPNIIPILINFGIMSAFGIRLDSATSIISAIGIGIIIDDTIHFLHTFGEEIKMDNDYTNAMYRTLLLKGRPIVLTSLIIFFGFGALVFSKFMPTVYVGLLSALLMCTALWGDLIVLPSLLLHFKPRFNQGRERGMG